MDINKDEKINNQIETNLNQDESEVDYKEVVRGILRKKKWGIVAGSLAFFAIFGYTINERYTNPVFIGSFDLLINDPINPGSETRARSSKSESFYQSLASNRQIYDVDSLIPLLSSPEFLTPLAKKYNINPKILSSRIKISLPKSASRFRFSNSASGLKVTMTTKNKARGLELLKDLSTTYLNESLNQKAEKT